VIKARRNLEEPDLSICQLQVELGLDPGRHPETHHQTLAELQLAWRLKLLRLLDLRALPERSEGLVGLGALGDADADAEVLFERFGRGGDAAGSAARPGELGLVDHVVKATLTGGDLDVPRCRPGCVHTSQQPIGGCAVDVGHQEHAFSDLAAFDASQLDFAGLDIEGLQGWVALLAQHEGIRRGHRVIGFGEDKVHGHRASTELPVVADGGHGEVVVAGGGCGGVHPPHRRRHRPVDGGVGALVLYLDDHPGGIVVHRTPEAGHADGRQVHRVAVRHHVQRVVVGNRTRLQGGWPIHGAEDQGRNAGGHQQDRGQHDDAPRPSAQRRLLVLGRIRRFARGVGHVSHR